MTDAEILANAPSDKNHYFVLNESDFTKIHGGDGYINNTQGICRSLADIREIESLRKKLATAKADAVNETYRAIPANLITADAPSWFCDRIDKLRRGE